MNVRVVFLLLLLACRTEALIDVMEMILLRNYCGGSLSDRGMKGNVWFQHDRNYYKRENVITTLRVKRKTLR